MTITDIFRRPKPRSESRFDILPPDEREYRDGLAAITRADRRISGLVEVEKVRVASVPSMVECATGPMLREGLTAVYANAALKGLTRSFELDFADDMQAWKAGSR